MSDILTEVRFWMMVMDAERRTVVCSPENKSRVKGYIDARGMSGLLPVKVSPFLPDDQILLIDEGALQAELRRPRPIRVWP